ncbi:hypothetical protein K3728_07805 [Rhodobacteraceae bacterium M385]|nr:hypothetical protein K3728_07805 [Rhodobacteraceae bacterium M385]
MKQATIFQPEIDHCSSVTDLDLLWQSQFGSRTEVWIRCVCIALAGLLFWAYEGALIGPIWSAIYLLGLWSHFVLLRPRTDGSARNRFLCIANFGFLSCLYLAMPVYLMIGGHPFLSFCAALAVIAFAVFTLFRSEPPGYVVAFEVTLIWGLVVTAAYAFMPIGATPLEHGLIAAMCIVLGLYYTMAVAATRKDRKELRLALRRNLEAQKMEAIGRLSGGVAHDFNNILSVVQGSLELYYEVTDEEEKNALVADASAATARASGLVAQLLAFARRAPLEAHPHDAQALVKGLCTLAGRVLPASITLEHQLPEKQVFVLADATRLHAALLNLILNASDAMEGHGKITLAVALKDGPADAAGTRPAESPQNAHVCFRVADNGPGMTPEVSRRAVEPFFTTKSVGKGSGLGLSMTMGFAEQSGGAMRIKTSAAGTTVLLHLPLSLSAEVSSAPRR